MNDWKQKKYPAESEVIVQDVDGKHLGIGKLIREYDSEYEPEDFDDWKPVEIKMSDGKILFGYECWWIPVNEVEPEYRPGGSKWKE